MPCRDLKHGHVPWRGRDGGESPCQCCAFRPEAVEFDRHVYETTMSFRTLLTPRHAKGGPGCSGSAVHRFPTSLTPLTPAWLLALLASG
jgi:hypothetical protein